MTQCLRHYRRSRRSQSEILPPHYVQSRGSLESGDVTLIVYRRELHRWRCSSGACLYVPALLFQLNKNGFVRLQRSRTAILELKMSVDRKIIAATHGRGAWQIEPTLWASKKVPDECRRFCSSHSIEAQ